MFNLIGSFFLYFKTNLTFLKSKMLILQTKELLKIEKFHYNIGIQLKFCFKYIKIINFTAIEIFKNFMMMN